MKQHNIHFFSEKRPVHMGAIIEAVSSSENTKKKEPAVVAASSAAPTRAKKDKADEALKKKERGLFSFLHQDKERKKKTTRVVDEGFKPHSHEHRILHVTSATLFGGVFLAMSIFFSNLSIEAKDEITLERVVIHGTVETSSERGEEMLLTKDSRIFTGDTLRVLQGEAEIYLENDTVLRLQEGSSIYLKSLEGVPEISVLSGTVWAFSLEKTLLLSEGATFSLQQNAVLLNKDGPTVQAAAYRHPVEAVFDVEGGGNISFLLPSQKEIQYADTGLPSVLASLRYSKLTKELRMRNIQENAWANANAAKDKQHLQSVLKQMEESKSYASLDRSALMGQMVFFEDKRVEGSARRAAEEPDALIHDIVFAHDFSLLEEVAFSEAELNRLVNIALAAEVNQETIVLFQTLDKNFPHFTEGNAYARALLALVEQSMKAEKSTFHESLLLLTGHWNKRIANPENTGLLTATRENLLSLYKAHPATVDQESLRAVEALNTLLFSTEKDTRGIALLETIQQHLGLIRVVLEDGSLDMAKELFEMNEGYFQEDIPYNLSALSASLQGQSKELEERYAIYRQHGRVSPEEYANLLQEREKTLQNIALLKESSERSIETPEEHPEEQVEKNREEELYNHFAAEEIILLSFLDEGGEAGITIQDAILPSGQHFQAKYSLEEKIISDIQLQGEGARVIAEDIPLSSFAVLVERLKLQSLQEEREGSFLGINTDDSWKTIEKDPLDEVDPLVIDVNKRFAKLSLEAYGFTTTVSDMTAVSGEEIFVEHIGGIPDHEKLELSLIFHVSKKSIRDVLLTNQNVVVEAESLGELSDAAKAAYEVYQEEEAKLRELKIIFSSMGIETEEDSIRIAENQIFFQNVRFQNTVLHGTVDGAQKTFLSVFVDNEEILSSVSYQDFPTALQEALSPSPSITP